MVGYGSFVTVMSAGAAHLRRSEPSGSHSRLLPQLVRLTDAGARRASSFPFVPQDAAHCTQPLCLDYCTTVAAIQEDESGDCQSLGGLGPSARVSFGSVIREFPTGHSRSQDQHRLKAMSTHSVPLWVSRTLLWPLFWILQQKEEHG